MPSLRVPSTLLLGCLVAAGCGRDDGPSDHPPITAPAPLTDRSDLDPTQADLYVRCQSLAALHEPPPPVRPGDWLARFDEPGQTFGEYLDEDPVTPEGKRRRIYVLPIGQFDEARQRVLDRVVEGLGLWFGLEVQVEDRLALTAIPEHARRRFPRGGWLQLRTGYLMNGVLRKGLPEDAACRIGFCTADLWPGEGWNYVFGEASLVHRVGVWSLYRDGDPSQSEEEFRRCLRRALKTATHEIGHMFGMLHCTAWSCNLAGCNHQEESDRHPWRLCPECLPKHLWATGGDGARRHEGLAAFAGEAGLAAERDWFLRAAARWRADR